MSNKLNVGSICTIKHNDYREVIKQSYRRKTAMFILDLDAETIRGRRPDLQVDRRLEARLQAFRLES